jgi:signal recognition particle subunit SRP54
MPGARRANRTNKKGKKGKGGKSGRSGARPPMRGGMPALPPGLTLPPGLNLPPGLSPDLSNLKLPEPGSD